MLVETTTHVDGKHRSQKMFLYFTIRLFFTDLTPLTLFAISVALSTSFCELTKPLRRALPLKASTLI